MWMSLLITASKLMSHPIISREEKRFQNEGKKAFQLQESDGLLKNWVTIEWIKNRQADTKDLTSSSKVLRVLGPNLTDASWQPRDFYRINPQSLLWREGSAKRKKEMNEKSEIKKKEE